MSRFIGNPVARITESYRALYLGNETNDTEADEALRKGLLNSFRKHDTLVSEIWTEGGHRDVFGYGVELGVEELQKSKITKEQRNEVYQRLDKFLKDVEIFTGSDTEFYKEVYNQYEKKYDGETVDFYADMNRYYRSIENEEVPEQFPEFEEPKEMTASELEQMVAEQTDELFDNYKASTSSTRKPVRASSGLSYSKPSIDVEKSWSKQETRTYETKAERQSRIRHERIFEDMRQESGGYDKQHHEYVRKRNPNQHFTHGDSYGIEETDIRVKPKEKDDGLELG